MNQLVASVGSTPGVEDRERALLEELETLAEHLVQVFGELAVGWAWLRSPNPVLAGEAPLQFVLRGQPEVIRRLLIMADTGMLT